MIFNKLSAFDQIVPLDLACVDYLGLMASERARVSRREELDDLVREVKALAINFGNGRGLPVEAAYQVNRSSYQRAREVGYYDLNCFAESSEVEKSCDSASYLLFMPQNPDELKMGFLKNRDDEIGEPWFIQRNLRYAQLCTLSGASSTGRVASPASTGAQLLDV